MAFLAIVNAYTMRSALNVTIIRITNPPVKAPKNSTEVICVATDAYKQEMKDFLFVEAWSEQQQSLTLSSFYIGYLITHVPGGLLCEIFGGKWILCLGILTTAIFTILTPESIYEGGLGSIVTLRILMGLGEGTTFPALSNLLSQWVPLKERGCLGAFVFGGGQMGSILGNFFGGIIQHKLHWSWVYYTFGVVGVIWCILFCLLCYSDPESHPCIRDSEKEYLRIQMGQTSRKHNLATAPILDMMKNKAVIALIFAQIGHDWGFYVMSTYLPKYMDNVLKFNILKSGFFASLPSLSMWIISLSSGCLADVLINRGVIKVTFARKMFTTMGKVIPGICMMAASYLGCNKIGVVMMFTLMMGSMGTYYAGMKLNPLDLSPNYSGTLMAIVNGIGSITGIISPLVVGALTPHGTLLEWRMVFWVTLGILLITSVIYIIWGSADIQLFNDVPALKAHKAEQKRLKAIKKAEKAAANALKKAEKEEGKVSATPSAASAKAK
ncbi:hypothetical protein ACFFRR_003762 [Megaselia abdita]